MAFAYENLKFEDVFAFDEKGEKVKFSVPNFDDEARNHIRDMMIQRAKLPVKNLETYMRQVEAMCSAHHLVSIYEIDSSTSLQDIDLAILNAILEGESD